MVKVVLSQGFSHDMRAGVGANSTHRRASVPTKYRPSETACRWCGQPAGVVPLCSPACFRLAEWAGWFDPRRLWEKRNMKVETVLLRALEGA
jgi:hypothetical protein